MAATETSLTQPPVLSTPDDHLFSTHSPPPPESHASQADEELRITYEVEDVALELTRARWRVVALQFPDAMLRDAPRVVELLQAELARLVGGADGDAAGELSRPSRIVPPSRGSPQGTHSNVANETDISSNSGPLRPGPPGPPPSQTPPKLYILADTSYSACCVDEVAASHVAADGVVHYGRACLTPTSTLPVLYIYTRPAGFVLADAISAFQREFLLPPGDSDTTIKDEDGHRHPQVVVAADLPYHEHVAPLVAALRDRGYGGVVGTDVVRDPLGEVPNRRILWAADESVAGTTETDAAADRLRRHALFHIGVPPTALLLALTPRFESIHVLPVPVVDPGSSTSTEQQPLRQTTASRLLARRYPKVLAASRAGIIGILVNTLSAPSHLSVLSALRTRIARAGKKSYTVVVGRVNPAKLANYAEIECWVAVGCWESGLVEDGANGASEEYYRPIVTPFELELALQRDDERVWGSSWWAGVEGVVDSLQKERERNGGTSACGDELGMQDGNEDDDVEGGVDDDESAPPEFDLRTGKLISTSRPMLPPRPGRSRGEPRRAENGDDGATNALVRRPKNRELATIKGTFSPGAEFLRTQRTWTGLGSDFAEADAGPSTIVEEGRSGIARGYTVGSEDTHRR